MGAAVIFHVDIVDLLNRAVWEGIGRVGRSRVINDMSLPC